MKHLFAIADQYVQESDWKILAGLKFCLFAMGVWMGSFLTEKVKNPMRALCVYVFLVTYIPLMLKLVQTTIRYFRQLEK